MAAFPELFFSLTLQCTLILLVTRYLTAVQNCHRTVDQLWAGAHSVILVLCLLGTLLPHLRLCLVLWPDSSNTVFTLYDDERFVRALFWVWLTGVAVLSCGVGLSLLRTTLLVRSAVLMSEDNRKRLAQSVPGHVHVVVSSLATTPFCWQLHRPVIVLPDTMLDLPADEVNAVVRHELAHVQAGHPFRLFLQRLVEVLFWFHPLVWTASRRAALARELLSDRRAAENCQEATCLLRGLWRISEMQQSLPVDLPAGLSFAGHGTMLQRRVECLVQNSLAPVPETAIAGRQFGIFGVAVLMASMLWLPLGSAATARSLFSPWPPESAVFLKEIGISVRDYEIDARLLSERQERESGFDAIEQRASTN